MALVKREESRKAQILFAIVIFFVVCNVPLTVLNIEEFTALVPPYWQNYKHILSSTRNETTVVPFCYSPPFWADVLGSISKLLLTLNASMCTFMYCAMCQIFRNEISTKFHTAIKFLSQILPDGVLGMTTDRFCRLGDCKMTTRSIQSLIRGVQPLPNYNNIYYIY